jgi:hypothetical protein
MDETTNHLYRDPNSSSTHAGDPFAGTPVPRYIVEEVAADHDTTPAELARVLRDFEKTPGLAPLETLLTGFDPMPVGVTEAGHLLLQADADSYWDATADELGLTEIGRDALVAAHDRHVTNAASLDIDPHRLGVVTFCPEFPAAAIEDVRLICARTPLSNRQATIWALNHRARSAAAIAAILDLSKSLVRSEIAAIDRASEEATTAARTFTAPQTSLTPRKSTPTAEDWLGLDWSSWYSLHDRTSLLNELPRAPGVYRVRHSQIPGLLYIGETGSEGGIRSRVGLELADGMTDSSSRAGGSHDATQNLAGVKAQINGSLEVSVATPPIATNRRHRRAIEAALIAVCRREIGWTPSVQLNRAPLTAKSENSDTRTIVEKRSEAASYPVPDWTGWRAPTDPNWMGLDWTSPRSLAERDSVELPDACAFRVWTPQEDTPHWDRTITRVGTTETPSSRLFSLESTYGPESIFAIAGLPELSADSRARSRERSEVRYDLVGAHYLTAGQPPRDQF